MEIKTKYNIGDKLWVMKNNKPTETSIEFINVTIMTVWNKKLYDPNASMWEVFFSTESGIINVISYVLANGCGEIGESTSIYKTKEDLLKNL